MTAFEPPRPGRWNWAPDEQPTGGQQAALRRLAAALRKSSELMMDTGLDEEALNAAATEAEAFLAQLEAGPKGRPHWGYGESANSGNTRAFFDSSPLIGLGNPVAPPLFLRMVDGQVHGTAVFGQQYEGPPRHVHGGIVAAAFDEVLGMVQSATGRGGMTGTLTVRYRRPTPLDTEVTFRGWVERVEGRKIFTASTLHHGDTLCAESEGIFIAVREGHFQSLAESRQQA